MEIQVVDENVISSDQIICGTKVKISSLCVNGGLDDWWTLSHDGQKVGSLHLIGQWTPAADTMIAQKEQEIQQLEAQNLEAQQKA
jgi:hypothetical protein